jgi:hypothetical protein
MNFSNIYSYINIPTRDSITNVLTSISNNVMFCSRAIKQYTPKRIFVAAAITTLGFNFATYLSARAIYGDINILQEIFNNIDIYASIELTIFFYFLLGFFIVEDEIDLIIIERFKDYQREKMLTLAIKNLQLLPNNHDYNKAKECPISHDILPEDATVCYGKTFYDAKFLYKWLLEGNDIDPMTAQKITWSKLYKVSPATVRSILNSDY